MRFLLIAGLIALPAIAPAQNQPLSNADSALIGRVLLAEDRRDSSDPALAEGLRHADPRVRALADRARGRIRDPLFAARDSLPPLPSPPTWPEPAWRLRYRALAGLADRTAQTGRQNECSSLRAALADSAWQVRLRAADLLTVACATDDSIVATLGLWVRDRPTGISPRPSGGVSWHAAAHAIMALTRLASGNAHLRLLGLLKHPQWQLRMYAARAEAVLSDTFKLRTLARDSNDNVREAAIEGLARVSGHADDTLFIAALGAEGAQAVRAAAVALKGSRHASVRAAANAAFERWVARQNASARDVRLALLEAAGRPATDDRTPTVRTELPPQAVAMALGAEVCLRVMMDTSSGGGAFVVRLRGDIAPMTGARILALARAGYYDGLGWHRVEPDFVIQGGTPGDNEYVGFPQYFRDELGTVPHRRGTVGMSTRGHDTGDAQWFINLKDNPRLARDYTVFGEVIAGIDVVDGILEGDVIATMREATCTLP